MPQQFAQVHEVDDPSWMLTYCYAQGCLDGLPAVPPAHYLVAWFLEEAGIKGDDSLTVYHTLW